MSLARFSLHGKIQGAWLPLWDNNQLFCILEVYSKLSKLSLAVDEILFVDTLT